jgi:predicted acetyltransferase
MAAVGGRVSVEVRLIGDDHFESWDALLATTFGYDPKPEDVAAFRKRVEMDRARAAYEGSEIVGTAGEYSFEMTTPGGEAPVPTAGVTAVVVKATHRRRGVLTRMMRHQLAAVADRGEPLAALWASESSIYGRFGYGVAIEGADVTIDRAHAVLDVETPRRGAVRLVTTDEARSLLPDTYRRATAGIPGTIGRPAADWELYFYDPEHWRDGASSARYAVFERSGRAEGYVRYRQKPDWADGHPNHELRVGELHAADAEAYAALFRYVFSIDLVTGIRASNRRVHEPLGLMLIEPRRLRRTLSDRIWLRILDVPAALSSRRYGAVGTLVLEVVDAFGGFAAGRYLLEGGPDGAECRRTDRDADLTLSVADLGSAYLGNARLGLAAWVGRVRGDEAAVRLADAMFSWHVEPWCTVGF